MAHNYDSVPQQPWTANPPPSLGSVNGGNSSRNSMGQQYDESAPFKASNEGSMLPLAAGAPQRSSKKKWIILGGIAGVIIVVLAVVLPVYFTVIKKNDGPGNSNSDNSSEDSSESSTGAPRPSASAAPNVLTTGGDGSEITMANGEKFTYRNSFGGVWVSNPEDPFNMDARPNTWTPPLNTTWRWGIDRAQGVNLGGWFKYPGSEDEHSLTTMMRAAGTLDELEEHYKTFITEQDFAEIAGAGLNWLRIPIGFWAIETLDNEPFLESVSWRYFLQAVEWARKYGLRIYLDLHALPGSQNGLNHSARMRNVGFLHGNMGIANGQRALSYLRVFTQFISQPQYRDVIGIFGIVNEPESRSDALYGGIGQDVLRSWYLEAYRVIREVSGFGEGNGPYIAVGDGFRSALEWEGLMPGADRFIMDIHPYVAFDEGSRADPIDVAAPDGELGGIWPGLACERWGTYFNETRQLLGVTVGGEFSGAVNDCGLFMRAVGVDSQHSQCALYNDWENWTPQLKEGLYNFILASFDAIGDYFWWTWKIGDSAAGRVETPMWSYKLGLQEGWIPRDPRVASGKCAALGAVMLPFGGIFQQHQTGGLASPTIPADYSAANPWPPAAITGADVPVELLPTYTFTGPAITLPVPTFTAAPSEVTEGLDGWYNDEDTLGGAVPVAGCVYPDQYVGSFAAIPTAQCTGA
ncbi:exo-beta-1,3-glucanase [Coprinopsis sp. MPI-PUGE-AT-0042]|nr:exo-beta-1,3-glucanase [Coprinopsis sp. MPI-PUGE-AT-0042]